MSTGPKFLPKTVEIAGDPYRYAVYVPEAYAQQRAWPVILYLHGIGERGDDGERHTHHGLGKAIRENPERFPCIVVLPQCRSDQLWSGRMLDMAMAALDAACRDYAIDRRRILLTGLSMGGFGTWSLGAAHAERFAALAPICGGGDPADAPRLARLPIWCFHGDADPVIPVQRSREMVEAVRAAGGQVTYTEFPGVGHNSWDPAYGDPEVIAWMLAQHRGG